LLSNSKFEKIVDTYCVLKFAFQHVSLHIIAQIIYIHHASH